MKASPPEDRLGELAVDERLLRALRQYRTHLELIYPFAVLAIASFLVEIRLELIELLFDFEEFQFIVDRELLEGVLTERTTEQLVPFLEELFVLLILGVLTILLLTVLVFLGAVGIAFLVAGDDHRSVDRSQLARLAVVIRRLPALFVAAVLSLLAISVGLLFLVLPGIYLAGKLTLAGPAIVIDGYGPIEGLRYGWNAATGQLVSVLGLLAVGFVAFVLVAFLPVVGELLAIIVVVPVVSLGIGTLYVESGIESSPNP